ncbi:DUF305 domain-containing protein [Nocardioides sp. zg-1228]|uniref:DUF305 domain-containing protein n=1 Tax=Nocardioides sp. zg-1228 TaxID=2763008 RepID=UPI0016423DDC|nr:DUF305 domain-containing protein [Nocardioides sp. zg-1228]MBC2933294.1 DUF305 domain-containing protein [Nocardioides sp. zg-1228]QSF56543.1 DUF305 domain-containing protein [Nocardioides sp. zg-1228]
MSALVRVGAVVVSVAVALGVSGCTGEEPSRDTEQGAPVVQLGAPGEAGKTMSPEEVESLAVPTYTASDVAFVEEMVPHHTQALEMTALVADRTGTRAILTLAERIEVSQVEELAQLEGWLTRRGEGAGETPDDHGSGDDEQHDDHGDEAGGAVATHAGMPGMATPEQMERLADARGRDFDRLFLQLMIRHHEGAIVMVETLLADGSGGQESEVFQLATHIASDQAVEVASMKRQLTSLDG